MSAAWSKRYVGAPAPPTAGPAKTAFCAAFVKMKLRAGVLVAVATLVVNSGARVPAEKVVTVPSPGMDDVGTHAVPLHEMIWFGVAPL